MVNGARYFISWKEEKNASSCNVTAIRMEKILL